MSLHRANPPALEPAPFPELRIRPDPPRILMLYGSLRARAYSRLLAEEAAQGGRITPIGSRRIAAIGPTLRDRGASSRGHGAVRRGASAAPARAQ